MSEHGHCHDCGGSDGHHFNDCSYDGTSGRGYSSSNKIPKWIVWILAILIISACVGVDPEIFGAIFAIPVVALFIYGFCWIFK